MDGVIAERRKAAHLKALAELKPGDRFCILLDYTMTQGVSDKPVPVGALIEHTDMADGVPRLFRILEIHDGCQYVCRFEGLGQPEPVPELIPDTLGEHMVDALAYMVGGLVPVKLIDRAEAEERWPSPVDVPVAISLDPGAAPDMAVAVSRAQGYTGDPCSQCGQLKLKVSGHCMVCDACGTTTGCS